MRKYLALLAVVIFTVSGDGAEPAPPPRPRLVYYFPVTTGAKWAYMLESGKPGVLEVVFANGCQLVPPEGKEVVVVVTAVKDGEDGAKIVSIGEFNPDGSTYPTQIYEVSERGLFWTKNMFGTLAIQPFCELKLPHKDGQTFGNPGNDVTMTAYGPEMVKVPAGEFECIRVVYQYANHPGDSQVRWYSPGIGLVKIMRKDGIIILKSFNPGKD